ncbi:MAG TPA: plastocyanin/azurin family copper-binding protein [Flavobacteriaceae bacterium]|nr:plastocyanin/azurin family copper-binding protein [Flavobacteriaceae bacterium]
MKKIAYFSLILASVAFLFTACGDDKKKESPDSQDTEVATSEKEETTSAEEKDSDKIVIIGNDQMRYDKTSIKAKAGEEITIVLKTVSDLPADVMSHDLVVLKQGTTSREFGQEAAKAGGLDKMTDEQKEPVIIATDMLADGEEDEITFTLDEPGEYEYVCTFPGHFPTMHGVITVE